MPPELCSPRDRDVEAGNLGSSSDRLTSSGDSGPSSTASSSTHESAAETRDAGHLNGAATARDQHPSSLAPLNSFRGALEELARNGTLGGSRDSDGESAAAAAERHRLANSVGIDLPSAAQWFERALPFFLLLFVVFIYRHIKGIAAFVWLSAVLAKSNDVVRKQVALKQDSKRSACTSLAGVMCMHIALVLLLLHRQRLWLNFVLIGTAAVPTAWDVFFRVSIVDVLVRFWGVALKSVIVALHANSSRHELRKRAQVLTVVEHALVFYRTLLATPVWYQYFTDSHMGSILASSCTGLYMMLKCSIVFERGALLLASGKALVQRHSAYGGKVTAADLCEAGNQCAICQEVPQGPVKLQCSHIFCEPCISEWFERERTCPMCRAEVQPAGLNMHSDGGTSLLPQLF